MVQIIRVDDLIRRNLILCTDACTLRENLTMKLANSDYRNPATVVTQLISAVVKNRVRMPPVLWPRIKTSQQSVEVTTTVHTVLQN